MSPVRIDIPDAHPRDDVDRAIEVVESALSEAGISYADAMRWPAAVEFIGMWMRGEKTRAEFVQAMRKLIRFRQVLREP